MSSAAPPAQTADVRLGTTRGRGVLIATVLGSGMSFLDGLVVNVALPRIDKELHLGVSGLQWVVSGYTMVLTALLLLGGSLGDRFGRRRVYLIGLLGFSVASLACAFAPSTAVLVAARIVQGGFGALAVPASLAIIQSSFAEEDRGAAVGMWTGLSAIFTALGPFVGGVFVQYLSWRWAFVINLPLGLVAWAATHRCVPETSEPGARDDPPDFVGAVLATSGLAGVTYWAIEGSSRNAAPWPLVLGMAGVVALLAFVYCESKVKAPLLSLSLFKSLDFTWLNIVTILFYGAFVGGITFFAVRLQTGLHYGPLEASLAGLPTSVIMFVLSSRWGALAQKYGPRAFLAGGMFLVALALLWMSQIVPGRHYWNFIFPSVVLWGIGLSMVVSPLTSSVLAAAGHEHSGVASAVNNMASRLGQSLAVALLPVAAGIGGGISLSGPAFAQGYERALMISSALGVVAAVVALSFVSRKSTRSGKGRPLGV